ncbi:MAG: hypothetical protein LBE18_03495 [Planctomycetaceae bacterium]|jgi:tRNA A37 methylthiotransferase MiaB|nr:hypothetical protein [Planctomycetaceae bacterium]
MKLYMDNNFCTVYKLDFNRLSKYISDNAIDVEITDDLDKAEVVILGLCAAFEADEKRSYELIKSISTDKKCYVYGCYTKVREDIVKNFTHVKYFFTWEIEKMAQEIVRSNQIHCSLLEYELPTNFRREHEYRVFDSQKSFVAITTGCSFECTYCPHKLGAGPPTVIEAETILKQVSLLLEQGTRTIFLTGIDTAAYSKIANVPFSTLLQRILLIAERERERERDRELSFMQEFVCRNEYYVIQLRSKSEF